jgi:CheY-like chemotaxis protein
MKILIVEDNKSDSEPWKLHLELLGHSVDITEYADEAIKLLKEEKIESSYDAVIIDIALRDSEGVYGGDWEGGIRVAEYAIKKGKKIVAVTDVRRDIKDEDRYPKLIKAGVKDHLILDKPVRVKEILEKLESKQSEPGKEK